MFNLSEIYLVGGTMANAEMGATGVGREYSHRTSAGVGGGMIRRIFRSVTDMPGQVALLLSEQPSEARLLSFVLLSDVFFALAWSIEALVAPSPTVSVLIGSDLALFLVIALIFRTTLVYALALAVAVGMRFAGFGGTIRETRTGVLWGSLVAAPIGFVVAMAVLGITALSADSSGAGYDALQVLPVWIGAVPFLWFVAKGAAAANRSDKSFRIFVVLGLGAVALALMLRVLAA